MKVNHHKICQNCEEPLNGLYCNKCGQKDFDDELKVSSIFFEWLDEHFGVNGTLWRTFKKLILSPTYLPKRYIEGHRVGYIRPIRLLITLTLFSIVLNQVLDISPAIPTGKFDSDSHLPEMATGVYAFNQCEIKLVEVMENFDKNYRSRYILKLESEGKTSKEIDSKLARYKELTSTMCHYTEKIDTIRMYLFWILIPLLTFLSWVCFRKKEQLKLMHIFFFVLYYSSIVAFLIIVWTLLGLLIFHLVAPDNVHGIIYTSIFSFFYMLLYIILFRKVFEVKGFSSLIKLLLAYFLYFSLNGLIQFLIGYSSSLIL